MKWWPSRNTNSTRPRHKDWDAKPKSGSQFNPRHGCKDKSINPTFSSFNPRPRIQRLQVSIPSQIVKFLSSSTYPWEVPTSQTPEVLQSSDPSVRLLGKTYGQTQFTDIKKNIQNWSCLTQYRKISRETIQNTSFKTVTIKLLFNSNGIEL